MTRPATVTPRYGTVKIATIRKAYNDLRNAVRAHDSEAAEAALDRYEQWADYVFGALPCPDAIQREKDWASRGTE